MCPPASPSAPNEARTGRRTAERLSLSPKGATIARSACAGANAAHGLPMARRTRRLCEAPVDLFKYLHERSVTSPPERRIGAPLSVVDDWPAMPPVTDHEARIIEAFFADVLDELFGSLH